MVSRTSIAVCAVLSLVTLFIALPAQPASAHDQMLASTPADNAALPVAPTEVTLQFSDDILTMGAVVVVVDENGKNWVAPVDLTLDGPLVTAALEPGMPDAGYEIRWQVVSGDGHPISDLLHFTVGDAEPYSSAQAAESGGNSAELDVESQESTENAAIWRVLLIGAIGAAIAVTLFALISIIGHSRSKRARGSESTSPRRDSAEN